MFGYRLRAVTQSTRGGRGRQSAFLSACALAEPFRGKGQARRLGVTVLRAPRAPVGAARPTPRRVASRGSSRCARSSAVSPRRSRRAARPEWRRLRRLPPRCLQDASPTRLAHARPAPGAGRRLPRAVESRASSRPSRTSRCSAARTGRHRPLRRRAASRRQGPGLADRHVASTTCSSRLGLFVDPPPAGATRRSTRLRPRTSASRRQCSGHAGCRNSSGVLTDNGNGPPPGLAAAARPARHYTEPLPAARTPTANV